MAGKKGQDNSKKVAGQARKADTAAQKAAGEEAKKAAAEAADKSNMKSGVRFHVTADFVYRSVLWPLFGLPTLQEEEGAVSSLSSRLCALVRHFMAYIPSKSRFAH
ncbi:hypothetical protein N0V85_000503 [Neurospora sp. IMI 360204]|nr:hypothetical protein N0V85_000503 [Neurospora sp. IMI 360204]